MPLTAYNAKRDFKITPEPPGKLARRKKGELRYLIQKHAASHLHYDFRLELDGVLLSWAVPKGPSLDPADKRLAMHVEDHPVEYGNFEGTIPKGQYGGGTVMLWDTGTWTPVGDPHDAYKKGHLKFDLHGKKLGGRWALVRTKSDRYGGGKEAWLLIKDRDGHAKRGDAARIVEDEPDSVVSGRSIDEIASANDREWHSNRSVADNVKAGAINAAKLRAPKKIAAPKVPAGAKKKALKSGKPPDAGPLEAKDARGARRASLPLTLEPQLATLVKAPPAGDGWIHEVKYDGYRMLCRIDKGRVRMDSRNGKDWSGRFGAIIAEAKKLKLRTAWLDGEVCAVDEKGRSNFQALQNALADPSTKDLIYFVFDVIYLDGYDLRNVALTERKRVLRGIVGDGGRLIRYSLDVEGAGSDVYQQACQLGIEGIVSKEAGSTYATGLRTKSWLKVKCSLRQEMVIGGFTDPEGSRTGFGALLIGVYEKSGEQGRLKYAGKVGTGFDERLLTDIRAKLAKLERDTPPFTNPPTGYAAKGAHWVEPKLVAEVEFTEWSQGGSLRHPSFIGLREDKQASEVARERPDVMSAGYAPGGSPAAKSGARKAAGPARSSAKSSGADDDVAGVKISHPDKLLFPEAKLSKLALARYYEAIGDWILPLLKDRPLSLVRCPDGWSNTCFFQKNADKSVHESVSRVKVPVGGGTSTYFAVSSVAALVGLTQWGVIEFHPWGSRMPRPERPDMLIFDFDPDDDVAWEEIVKSAQEMRTLLRKMGFCGFLKTTGGKGLHVVVPIEPTLDWAQAKEFTRAIAEMFTRAFPDRFVATVSKAKRKGKIFIDYLRNQEGATAIGAYCIRARKNAPVSTPVAWTELGEDLRFDHFNVKTVPARLAKLKRDPWRDFEAKRAKVTAEHFKQVGVQTKSRR